MLNRESTKEIHHEIKREENHDQNIENKLNIGKIAFARSTSYAEYKEIHPEESVDDYYKLRVSEVEISTRDLRELSKKYKGENSKSFDQKIDDITDALIKELSKKFKLK